jgi:hypothetical protein
MKNVLNAGIMKSRLCSVVVSFWFINSCQSVPKNFIPINQSGYLEKHFDTCEKGFGESRLKVKEERSFFTKVEWSFDPQIFIVDFIDDFGLESAHIEVKKQQNVINTRSDRIAIEPMQTKNEFIYYNGYFVGLKTTEIQCLLKGVLPQLWLDRIHKKDKRDYLSWDAKRSIRISMDSKKACAKIQWWAWFKRPAIDICRDDFSITLHYKDSYFELRSDP